MTNQIVPYSLDEDKFPLGRGLRCLSGEYRALDSANYFAGLLLDRLNSLESTNQPQGGLEGELERIYLSASRAHIGSPKAVGRPILTYDEGHDVKSKEGYDLSKLALALHNAKEDLSNLASKTVELWDLFRNLKTPNEERIIYNRTLIILDTLASYSRSRANEEYKEMLKELDHIIAELRSKPTRSR